MRSSALPDKGWENEMIFFGFRVKEKNEPGILALTFTRKRKTTYNYIDLTSTQVDRPVLYNIENTDILTIWISSTLKNAARMHLSYVFETLTTKNNA